VFLKATIKKTINKRSWVQLSSMMSELGLKKFKNIAILQTTQNCAKVETPIFFKKYETQPSFVCIIIINIFVDP
jgi:hypothetical protein